MGATTNPVHKMTTMLWPDEIREAELLLLSDVGQVDRALHDAVLAQMLVDTLSADAFAPPLTGNEYRDKLSERD